MDVRIIRYLKVALSAYGDAFSLDIQHTVTCEVLRLHDDVSPIFDEGSWSKSLFILHFTADEREWRS